MKVALSAYRWAEDQAAQQVWSYREISRCGNLGSSAYTGQIEESLRTQVETLLPLPLSIDLPITDQGPRFSVITPQSIKDMLLNYLPWQAQEFSVELPSMPTIPTMITAGLRFDSGIQIEFDVELKLVGIVPEHIVGELEEFQPLSLKPHDPVLQVLRRYIESAPDTDNLTRYERTGIVLITAFRFGYSQAEWIKELIIGWPKLRQRYLEESQVQVVIREVTALIARMGVLRLDWSPRVPPFEEIAGVVKIALERRLSEGAEWLQYVPEEPLDAQTHRVGVLVRGISVGEILVQRQISFLPDRVREELMTTKPLSTGTSQFITDEDVITFADRETGKAVDLTDSLGRPDYRSRSEALARVCHFLLDRDLLDNTQFRRTLWSYYAAKGAEQLPKDVKNARYYYLQFLRMYYQEGMREHLKALAPSSFPSWPTYLLPI